MLNKVVKFNNFEISNNKKISLISGPCQLETEQHAMDMAGKIKEIASKFEIGFIYKTSFDKANRTSLKGKRGAGLDSSLPVFDKIKSELKIPVLTDVTKKISESGNENILVTERGASFGYNTLVSDMRSIPIMAKNGYPIVFDGTHSVQQPGGLGEKSGGQREFVEYLSRAATAVGIAAIFLETHQDPDNAPSDGPNMVPLDKLESLISQIVEIDNLVKNK